MDIDYKTWGPRIARNVLRNTLNLKKEETLTIEVWTHGLPWVDSFVLEARKIGAHPMVVYESDNAFWATVEEGRAKSLGELGAQEWAALRETNAYVFFWGPGDRARWHSLPMSTEKAITSYEEEFFKLFKEKKIRWSRIELERATEESAKEYGISYSTWVKELLEASALNPKTMEREAKKVAERLENGHRLVITHPNGSHIELQLKGRKPYTDDGVVDQADVEAGFGESTVPSGVIQVAVDEGFAEGIFKATRPSKYGPARGQTDGGEWTFKDGKLEKYRYKRGESDFEKLYLKAGPERDLPATFSIGLNPKIHDAPLLEDQSLGVVTLYIGANEWLGGSTKGDFTSWLLMEGANVTVDDKPLLVSGKIT
jgi:leucyl aminopeptidase (aminopeptidase T)